MVPSRHTQIPKPSLDIWIRVDLEIAGRRLREQKNIWRVEKEDLLKAIANSPNSDDVIKKQMGASYGLIADALSGKLLDIWSVRHIEHGLMPPHEMSGHHPLRS